MATEAPDCIGIWCGARISFQKETSRAFLILGCHEYHRITVTGPNVKAFLLAAGKGTRLRPITDRTPKCLLPIGGVPLLGIWLELCCRHGIKEVLINLHAHARAVREYVAQMQ